MKTLLISLILAGIVSAEVPSLINYQGRLTNADGEPLTGTKNFGLKIFDAQTEGNLLYTETFDSVTLGEGGVYSFQFGGKGTSNAQITETVGTGDGSVFYQKVLSNTPVVDGSVSVSDGNYTWSQENGSSNEENFSASYSKNLSRITVNYFGGPNDDKEIKVTYLYEAEGIVGALSSGSEHWLQLSIDGETQATRERVLAVPFALRAGALAESALRTATKKYLYYRTEVGSNRYSDVQIWDHQSNGRPDTFFIIPHLAKKVKSIKCVISVRDGGATPRIELITFNDDKILNPGEPEYRSIHRIDFEASNEVKQYTFSPNWDLDKGEHYELKFSFANRADFIAPLVLEYEY